MAMPAASPTARPRIERFMGEGWGVYMMTYRGYGGGTGKPTEAAQRRRRPPCLRCARARGRGAVVDHPLWRVAGHGRCRAAGGGAAGRRRGARCALHLDRRRRRRRLSVPAGAAACSPTATRSTKYIEQVQAPLLILHGERDEVIPVAMGRELFAAGERAQAPVPSSPTAATATSTSTATARSRRCGHGSPSSGAATAP